MMIRNTLKIAAVAGLLFFVGCNDDEPSTSDIVSDVTGTYIGTLTINDVNYSNVEVEVVKEGNKAVSITSNDERVSGFKVTVSEFSGVIISQVTSNGDVVLAIDKTKVPVTLGYEYNDDSESYAGSKVSTGL